MADEPLQPLNLTEILEGLQNKTSKFTFTTVYEDWMPEKIVEVMSNGGTLTQAAVACRITRRTLYNFRNPNHPSYQPAIEQACEEGVIAAQAWWEGQGQKGLWAGKQFNDKLFSFNMKNRFKDEYSDKPTPEAPEPVPNPVIDALKETASADWEEQDENQEEVVD